LANLQGTLRKCSDEIFEFFHEINEGEVAKKKFIQPNFYHLRFVLLGQNILLLLGSSQKILRRHKLSNKLFYLLYIITGILALGTSIGLYLATWPSIVDENRKTFLHAINDFWLEDVYSVHATLDYPTPSKGGG
jgi:hypothetical protein